VFRKEVIPLTEEELEKYNFKNKTAEEQREIARKGGIASGEAKRRRKTFKEAIELLLEREEKVGEEKVTDEENNEQVVEILKSVQDIGLENLIKKYKNGDLQTFLAIRDTIGEKPVDKTEQQVVNKIKVRITDD
jgi:general stress protein YciG